MNNKGIIIKKSNFSVKGTIDRLHVYLQLQGATVYTRIDQQLELQKAGIDVRPIEFIMFGNPKTGGNTIKENPISALDLPLKLIAWEDDKKQVWMAYNDESFLADRYDLSFTARFPLNMDNLLNDALQ